MTRGRERREFWERGSRSARLYGALSVFVCFAVFDLWSIARDLPERLFGDEWRYLYYANNLLNGYFSPPERVFIGNGPGYPLFLVPFVKTGFQDGARYANAPLHAGMLAYAWLILRKRLPAFWSIVAVVALGFYQPLRDHLKLIHTEVLCTLLITGYVYHCLEATSDVALRFRSSSRRAHVVAAGALLGLLCLTKVSFGPATGALALVLVVVGSFFRREKTRTGSSRMNRLVSAPLQASLLALLLCLPYLAYTYSITGKVFYWANAWPNSIYWLTSPFPEETGDWYHQGWVFNNPLLWEHHGALFMRAAGLDKNPNLSEHEYLLNLSSLPASELFMQAAWENLRAHPLKFLSNWCWNLSRLFFDVPVSVRGTPFWNDSTKANLPLLLWTAFVVARAVKTGTRPPRHWYATLLLVFLNLAAYSFSSAVARFLIPLVPIWWLATCAWLGRIELRAKLAGRRTRRADPARAAHRPRNTTA